MKQFLFSLLIATGFYGVTQAQILFQEDFEGAALPADWTQITNATDSGWKVGSFVDLSSQFWPIAANGSIQVAATNDDACNCDKSQDYLITPPLDLTTVLDVVLSVDIFFGKGTYAGFTEQATIEISTDGINWNVLEDLTGHAGWATHQLDLSNFAGEDSVRIGFHYNDHGGFLYGLAIDNVQVAVPPALDAGLVGLKFLPYGEENVTTAISGTIVNNSLTPISSLTISYAVNGGPKESATLFGLDIQPFQEYSITHPTAWKPVLAGIYTIQVQIDSVNGLIDDVSANNILSFETEIFPHVTTDNRIDEFLLGQPVFTTIATAADGLDKPNDLDFFPILSKNELWVVNERIESSGGSTLTLYDAGTPNQQTLSRSDGNAWHFMSLPTGIAFSDNFNFATSPGVKDANHNNGTFTGPALWTSDPEIYAQPSGGNGSHLDMLHGSPFSMGIASEADNVFWVTDGWNSTIVRYDFQGDHGPGNDDHANGIVRRYKEIQFKKDGVVPSHLVLDKSTGWLYIADTGNDRIVRLDIHSGSVTTPLPLINEPLAEHSEMGGVTWEIVIDSLTRPSGIDIIDNRLLVGDYTSGDITVYDIENNFAELGRITTGQQGLTGIKVGPDGAIWYSNRLQNTIIKAEPGEPTAVHESILDQVHVYPNPTTGMVIIEVPASDPGGEVRLELTDLRGQKIMSLVTYQKVQQLNLQGLTDGMYLLSIYNNKVSSTRKIVLKG